MPNFPRLTEKQLEVHQSDARFRVLAAGRRFGKTTLALMELLFQVSRGENRRVWYVGPTKERVKTVAWDWLKEHTRPYWAKRPSETYLIIYLNDGGTIQLKSATRLEGLYGSGLDFVAVDECASLKPETWDVAIRPALACREGKALICGTPSGGNHFFHLFEKAKSTEDWAAYHYTTAEGGNVSEKEIAASRRDLDPKIFAQQFEASFETNNETRAYYPFSNKVHVKECEYDPIHPLAFSLDFNVAPMCAIVAQQKGDTIYVLKEIINNNDASTENTCNRFGAYLDTLRKYGPRRIDVYGDATGNCRSTSSYNTDWQIVRNFFNMHRGALEPHYYVPSSNPAVRDRVNCVNRLLQNAHGEVNLVIHPRCEELIKDLHLVQWSKHGGLDKSDTRRTHTSDALGYYLARAFPIQPSIGEKSTGRII